MKILLIGFESIGKKHFENLKILGESDVTIVDPYVEGAHYKTLNEMENLNQYDLAMICSPTTEHLLQLHILNDRGVKYIFVEKPLCSLPTDYQVLEQMGMKARAKELKSQVYVNYCYRFERGINKLKELIDNGLAGKIKHASFENSYSYKKMHPHYSQKDWEDYQMIYDDSHIWDYMRYLFGNPKDILSSIVKKDFVQANFEYDNDLIISVMTDVRNERYKKRIEVRGTDGTLTYNYKAHEIFFGAKDESERIAISYKHCCHLTEALKYVLNIVKSGKKFNINTIEDGVDNMILLENIMDKSNESLK